MKSFFLCLFLFPFFISCSNPAESGNAMPTEMMNRSIDLGLDLPARNATNPYDDAGQIQNELLDAYYSGTSLPTDFNGIVIRTTALANDNSSFMESIKHGPYIFTSQAKVLHILSHPDTSMSEAIQSSLHSERARGSLSQFIDSLLLLCENEADYAGIYNFIVTYENTILTDAQLTDAEKEVLLTTTSIARHSVYVRKKKPKKNTDPDWPLLIGNIAAALDGAAEGINEAVMRGVIVGIVENK